MTVQRARTRCTSCGATLRVKDQFCPKCGAAIPPRKASSSASLQVGEHTRAALAEQRKLVTTLFADLTGSTPLGEKLDPEDLRAILESYFGTLARQLRRYDATIDKYVGDAIMAVFGAPVSHEDDAERAIRAALAMQGAIAGLNDDLDRKYGARLGLKIGINTGEVVAGMLAGDAQSAYTVVGDSVNTAQRYESISPPGEIVVSEATRALAMHAFEFAPLPAVTLKGKAQPVIPYRVVRARDEEIQPEESPLVGRDAEITRMREALEAAIMGGGRLVHVSGEAGVGKSRLVREFRLNLAAPIARVVARCASYETNVPYAVVADLVRYALGMPPGQDQAATRQAVDLGLALYDVTFDEERLVLLLDVLGFGERSTLGPQVKRQVLVAILREILQGIARRSSFVIAIEDLQWIDSASMFVLRELAPELRRLPCLLVTTSRGATLPPWAAERIELEPLGESDARALLRARAKDDLDDTVVRRILDRTGGNPFFIEEVIRGLGSGGAEIPATVQEVIEARLDRLARGPRRAIEPAAVIGRSFWYRLLEKLVPDEWLAKSLAALEDESFIVRRAIAPELTYVFRQPLIQEVAYQMQLLSQRREMHGRVGAAIEELYRERLEEFVDLLAYHYERSNDGAKALSWLLRAADRARALYANDEALALYTSALARASNGFGPLDAGAIVEHIGDVQTLVGRYDDAIASYGRSIERAGDADQAFRARLLRKTGTAHRWKGDYPAALEVLGLARSALATAVDAEAAHIALQIGMAHFHRGEYDAARTALLEGVELGRRLGADLVLAEGLKILGNVANNLGDIHEAIERYVTSLEIYEQLGDDVGIADVRSNLGNMYRRLGRFDAALEEHRASLAIRERIGHRWGVGTSHNNIGEVLRSMGRPREAIPELERALDTWTGIGATAGVGLARANLGAARVEAGDLTRGMIDLRAALPQLQGTKFLAGANRELALAELAAGNVEAASRHANEALSMARAMHARHAEAQAQRILAEIALAQGESHRARGLLAASRTIFEELGEQTELARTDAVLARIAELA
jgi:class 3 adenylate cyclase/tetratricopeptide (TPR) repeat protein